MENPYEPPTLKREKYMPPIVDVDGLVFVLAVMAVPVTLIAIISFFMD